MSTPVRRSVETRHQLELSIRVGPSSSPAFTDPFAISGRSSFEVVFAARARRYRLSTRIVVALMAGFGIGVLAAVMLPVPEAVRPWIVLPSAALLPIAVITHLLNQWLRCPSC